MSILAALVRAYDRLPQDERPPFGYSMEKIGFVIGLHPDGSVATVTDIRDGEGRKKLPQPMLVPQPVKRTAGIAPNLLWDKTAYVLGVTAGEGKRTADEHAAFVARHEAALAENADEGLQALLLFLRNWTPQRFGELGCSEEMKDQNVIFALESERLAHVYLHDRPAAAAIIGNASSDPDATRDICLVSGVETVPARLHPSIKGVWGAQTAGAALVSFNLDAFTSYGHEQGSNAPVSEQAAFAYTSVLNRFLASGSGHRIQIGDASTVFWALCDDDAAADLAERLFRAMVDPPAESEQEREEREERESDDRTFSQKVGIQLERIRRGEPLKVVEPKLAEGVLFHVLGLSPNAARLSVRYWFDDDFGVLAENYRRFVSDIEISPPPAESAPALWRYLRETAVLGKSENVAPNLAGEWMRSILTGARYPATLLSLVLARIRADGRVNALRAAMLKAVLIRNNRLEVPVALDPDETNKGYVLGRLFAVYEEIQRAALGGRVNATIKDKFYGSASATPQRVFAALDRGAANHLAKLGKISPGRKVNLSKLLAEVMDGMSPDQDPFPVSLPAKDQALFGLGYFHQHSEFFRTAAEKANTARPANQESE